MRLRRVSQQTEAGSSQTPEGCKISHAGDSAVGKEEGWVARPHYTGCSVSCAVEWNSPGLVGAPVDSEWEGVY